MSEVRVRPATADIRSLFEGGGTAVGLTDTQLLDRYLARRAEAAEANQAAEVAFAALVARHGPMVLGVCRRRLADPADAEDSFQATFLVLARRAATIRVEGSLGRWLYGVVFRVFGNACSRRERHPSFAISAEPTSPEPEHAELKAALDEELARLPAIFASR